MTDNDETSVAVFDDGRLRVLDDAFGHVATTRLSADEMIVLARQLVHFACARGAQGLMAN